MGASQELGRRQALLTRPDGEPLAVGLGRHLQQHRHVHRQRLPSQAAPSPQDCTDVAGGRRPPAPSSTPGSFRSPRRSRSAATPRAGPPGSSHVTDATLRRNSTAGCTRQSLRDDFPSPVLTGSGRWGRLPAFRLSGLSALSSSLARLAGHVHHRAICGSGARPKSRGQPASNTTRSRQPRSTTSSVRLRVSTSTSPRSSSSTPSRTTAGPAFLAYSHDPASLTRREVRFALDRPRDWALVAPDVWRGDMRRLSAVPHQPPLSVADQRQGGMERRGCALERLPPCFAGMRFPVRVSDQRGSTMTTGIGRSVRR